MFRQNGRIEKHDEGFRFYEQDIVMSKFSLTGDAIISIKFKYYTPGIGIVFQDVFDDALVYLCRIGISDYSIIKKRMALEETVARTALSLSIPSEQEIKLLKLGDAVEMVVNNKTINRTIISDRLDRFYFGIYSSHDNIIQEVDVQSNTPSGWNTSVENVGGGLLSFFRNGFQLEDCRYNAEVEQGPINLKRGTYYFDYETHDSDIKTYIFYSNDKRLDDKKKNILKGNTLTLPEDSSINVKFVGTKGSVQNIAIKNSAQDTFIPTQNKPLELMGSKIILDMNIIKKAQWTGQIIELPADNEYGIISTAYTQVKIEELGIELGKFYNFTLYNINDWPFITVSDAGDEEINSLFVVVDHRFIKEIRGIDIGKANSQLYLEKDRQLIKEIITKEIDNDIKDVFLFKEKNGEEEILKQVKTYDIVSIILGTDKKINIFDNFKGEISEMKVTYKNGEVFNVIAQQSSFDYVPGTIGGPIIVVDGQNIPLDLSSSFRFYKRHSILTGTEENFYIFTNWEREIFSPAHRFHLEKRPLENAGSIQVYGVLHGVKTKLEDIFRIVEDEPGDIRAYTQGAGNFEILSENDFSYNKNYDYLELHGGIENQYQEFVVDYLKDESYCINYKKELNSFEIEISSSSGASHILFDQAASVMLTDIKADRNKYVLLSNTGR